MLVTVPAHAGDLLCKFLPFLPICGSGHPSPSVGVPEPATLALLVTGFGAAGVAAWRRSKKKNI
jgi:hypothetical protein